MNTRSSKAAIDHSRPIVLLHGFASSPEDLGLLHAHLERRLGRRVVSVAISQGREDLRASARVVHEALEALAAHPGFRYADVVAHSMGGLVATYVLKKLDRGRRLRRVVTLGTPHRGAPLARIGALLIGRIAHALAQMSPGSEFIEDLAREPAPEGTELISLAGDTDRVVPPACARLKRHARQRTQIVAGVHHTAFLLSRVLFRKVAAVLEDCASGFPPTRHTAMG